MIRRASGVLALLLLGLLGVPLLRAIPAAQQPLPAAPLFRSGINLVLVDVVVRDKKTGSLVTDLTKDDFEIDDEGKPQAIASFASVALPQTRTAMTNASADHLADNRRREGRLLLFLINDPAISLHSTGYLRYLLHKFVDAHMSDDDEVAIWPITNLMPRQLFTSDRARLDEVIDRVEGTAGTFKVPPDQVLLNLDELVSGMETINRQRKVIVLLGGRSLGIDSIGTPPYEDLLRQAAAANVAIYPISVTGVRGFEDVVSGDPPSARPGRGLPQMPLALNFLAQETGGVVANTNDFDRAFARVEEDAGTYYLIGFTPPADAPLGRFRHVDVKVRRAGVAAQARSGYTLSPGNLFVPSRASNAGRWVVPLKDVLLEPLPDSTLPLRIQASCFRDDEKRDVVVVTLRVDAPHERLAGRMLYDVAGTNAFDQIVDETSGASVIPAVTPARDVSIVTALHLPPGLSVIKAAMRIADGATGSVSLNIDVPDLGQPLAMSDIEIAPSTSPALLVGDPPAFIAEQHPNPIGTHRTFDASDTLAVYGEIYDSRGSTGVTASAALRDGAGRIQRRGVLALAPVRREAGGGSSALRYAAQLDLRGLTPGATTLEVDAADGQGHATTGRLSFQIRQ